MYEIEDTTGTVTWFLEKLGAKKATKAPAAPKVSEEDKKKQQELTAKRANEFELWKTWKKSGYKPTHLEPLLKSLNPLIQKRGLISGKGRVEVPTAAIDFELKKQVVKSLKEYDPNKGASLSTWVTGNMRKISRFIHNTQNLTRITEPLAAKIGTYNAVKADLTERLGHAPDDHTLHEELLKHDKKFSMKELKRLNKEIRKSYISGQGGLDDVQTAVMSSPDAEVIHLVVPQLTKPELAVHELTFGLNGKPKMAPGQIAKTLKMDNSKVAKLRTSIWKKMEPHLG